MADGSGGEPRYTLREAQKRLAERECANDGHDFDVVCVNDLPGGRPVRIQCPRCGKHWAVEPPPAKGQKESGLSGGLSGGLSDRDEAIQQIRRGYR